MTLAARPHLVSVDEYLTGEEGAAQKHEYLGGVMHAMSGGSNDHGAIGANAIVALGSQLRGKTCRIFSSDTKIRIELPDQTRFYYPDASVVCELAPGGVRFQERPRIVVEVLSESTRRTDLGEKKDAYLTVASLRVLMLVEPARASVLVYRRKPDGGFVAEQYDGLDAIVGLPEIEAELSLRDVYDGLTLAALAQ